MGAKGVRGAHLVQMCRVCVRQLRYSHVEMWSRARKERKSGLLVVQHQGCRSEYVTQQPRPKTWPYTSRDETAFIQQLGLRGRWLWGMRAVPSSDAALRTMVSKDRPHVPKDAKGAVHSGRGRCACGRQSRLGGDDDPVHPAGIKVVSRGGVRDHTHNSVRRRSQRSKRSIQTRSVRGGCGCIPSSDAETAIRREKTYVLSM